MTTTARIALAESLIAGATDATERQRAAQQLAALCDEAWAGQAPLYEVCVVLGCLYTAGRQFVAAEQLAVLAKRLVQAETRPGGPYTAAGPGGLEARLQLNISITYLFRTIGKPLAATERFIAQHAATARRLARQPFIGHALAVLGVADSETPLKSARTQTSPGRKTSLPYRAVQRELARLPEPSRAQALAMLARVEAADASGEIAHIARYFNASLPGSAASRAELTALGKANIYCWIAYMMYDHIIDGQASPGGLPVANICMRRSYDIYLAASPSPGALRTTRTAFDGTDQANAWELAHARTRPGAAGRIIIPSLPNYEGGLVLARRSLPHILGPLLLTARLHGVTPGQRRYLDIAWSHYLIAKQLSDDIHDWKDDLAQGQLTFVICHMLEQLAIAPGSYRRTDMMQRLQAYFWQSAMRDISGGIIQHLNQARQSFSASTVCRQSPGLQALLDRIERSTRQSLRQRDGYERFLRRYASRQS